MMSAHQELCKAILDSDVGRVHHLIQADDVNVNAKGPCDHRPLSLALKMRSAEVARALLQHGADVEASEIDDPTVGRNTILDGAFAEAAFMDEPERLSILLDAGLSVDYCNHDGWTLLARAAWNSVALTKWLLDRGADANVPSKGGWTPLMCAVNAAVSRLAGEEIREVVTLLVDAGADVRASNVRGESAAEVLDRQSTIDARLKEQLRDLLRLK
jgi:ankyrin repeat protein